MLEEEILFIMRHNEEITASSISKIMLNSKKKFACVSINPNRIADILSVLRKEGVVSYRVKQANSMHNGMWSLASMKY